MTLSWRRMVEAGRRDSNAERRSVEVRLEPNESVLLDYMPAGPVPEGRRCEASGVSLSVTTESTGSQAGDVIQTELWFVHRAPDGTEKSVSTTVKSRPHQEVPFIFDALRVSTTRGAFDVELSGSVLARPVEHGEILTTLGAWMFQRVAKSSDWSYAGSGNQMQLRVGGPSVVALELPPLQESSPLVGHSFSIRIRSRPLDLRYLNLSVPIRAPREDR